MAGHDGDEISPQQDRTLLMVLPIVLLVGLALTAGGVYLVRFHVELALNGVAAQGEVVGLEPGSSTGSSGRAAYFPVVTFRTPDGEQVTFRHRTGANPPAYQPGESVPVSYLPEDPHRALSAEGFMNLLLPGILVLVGPVLVVLSLRGMRGARRRLGR